MAKKEKFKDFLGREINIGNECVYIKDVRTGSSTTRKMLFRGVVTRITKHKVAFDENEHVVFPEDVVIVDFPKSNLENIN